MAEFRKWWDNADFIVQLLLAIFVGPIVLGIYRICRGDTKGIIWGIVWILTGGLLGVGAIIDLVYVIMKKPVWELN